jgi:hypothetical protein
MVQSMIRCNDIHKTYTTDNQVSDIKSQICNDPDRDILNTQQPPKQFIPRCRNNTDHSKHKEPLCDSTCLIALNQNIKRC